MSLSRALRRPGGKQLLGGMSIAVAMTGLDQDMMQKNLTVARLKDSQKNMVLLGVNLLFVNALFLALGILLTDYAALQGISATGDKLFRHRGYQQRHAIAFGCRFFLRPFSGSFLQRRQRPCLTNDCVLC